MIIVKRLRDIQEEWGYLPEAELIQFHKDSGIPLPRIQEVASFFPHFRQWQKPPYVTAAVCRDMTCHLRGAPEVIKELKKLERDGEKSVVVEGVSCLGRCDRAPAMCITRHDTEQHHHELTVADQKELEELHKNPYAHGDRDGTFHEWVYAGRSTQDFATILATIASGGTAPIPDWDYTYKLNCNEWLIDVYKNAEPPLKPYEAVRRFVKDHPQQVTLPSPLPKIKETRNGKDIEREWGPKEFEKFIDDKHPWMRKLDVAGLLGMGGAGVPAYRKWFEVWKAEGDEKYIVMNGDESEPGTFKDREILLKAPHIVVEGVLLAGLYTNATRGYIFIRHEYLEQIAAVRKAIKDAQAMNASGDNIFGSGRNFDVEVFVSPGGYICGEQSALIEAMEDRRAQPRNRPPELMTNGLRDKPTVVNNVETISWTPAIMLKEGGWYPKQSVGEFRGRRLFSISGDVAKPGVYEVPISDTLGDLIALAGGVVGGTLKALATSGPSGGLIPPQIPLTAGFAERRSRAIDDLDKQDDKDFLNRILDSGLNASGSHFDLLKLPLDLNVFKSVGRLIGVGDSRALGMMLGAGLAVYASDTAPNILDHAKNYTEFFRNESCGKCVPCRLGSQKLVEIGTDLTKRRGVRSTELPTVEATSQVIADMSYAMMMTSICSLGQVAANPLMTVLQYFPDDVRSGS